jgi:hypothetical protein
MELFRFIFGNRCLIKSVPLIEVPSRPLLCQHRLPYLHALRFHRIRDMIAIFPRPYSGRWSPGQFLAQVSPCEKSEIGRKVFPFLLRLHRKVTKDPALLQAIEEPGLEGNSQPGYVQFHPNVQRNATLRGIILRFKSIPIEHKHPPRNESRFTFGPA